MILKFQATIPPLTDEEFRQLEQNILAEAGAVLGIDPNTIRWQARDNPHALGFPVIVVKSRTYIPRLPFINFIKGGLPSDSIVR